MGTIKLKILCTQILNKEVIKYAKENDIYITSIPFIKTIPIQSAAINKSIKIFEQQKIAAIFTSKNAANAVLKNLTSVPNWEIFTLSGTTFNVLKNIFHKNCSINTALNAVDLAALIIAKNCNIPIVFFSGKRRLNNLPTILIQNNIQFSELVVYNTLDTPKKITNSFDGIIFLSPSSVQNFFLLNKINPTVILFAIGASTANTIKQFCINTIIECTNPSIKNIIDSIKDYQSGLNNKIIYV